MRVVVGATAVHDRLRTSIEEVPVETDGLLWSRTKARHRPARGEADVEGCLALGA
jgi:hypothetical protein